MTALLLGFATRFLPNVFSFIGDSMKAKQERKAEEATMRLQLQIEQAKAAGASDVAGIDADSAEILAGIQGSIDEMALTVADRDSARKFGSKALARLNETLQKGIDMNLGKFWLGTGWYFVLFAELLSSTVQPMIAAIVFSMWVNYKIQTPTFGPQDWELMAAIIGFFLAGRVKKHTGSE